MEEVAIEGMGTMGPDVGGIMGVYASPHSPTTNRQI